MSELLQAQLLQPLSAEPLQPSLSFANLDLARQPLFATGFNEYTSLLQGDGLRLRAEGEVGSSWTRGEEVAIGSLFDRVATSIGQSVLHTDGFRKDFNLDQSIEQAFIRIDPSELLSVQAELRQLNTHQGNRTLSFDPADLTQVNPTEHQDSSLSVYRVGARLKLGDVGDLVVSAIQSDLDLNDDEESDAGVLGQARTSGLNADTGHQVEAVASARSSARLPARGRRRGQGQARQP